MELLGAAVARTHSLAASNDVTIGTATKPCRDPDLFWTPRQKRVSLPLATNERFGYDQPLIELLPRKQFTP
jgi:hypothetical protein